MPLLVRGVEKQRSLRQGVTLGGPCPRGAGRDATTRAAKGSSCYREGAVGRVASGHAAVAEARAEGSWGELGREAVSLLFQR